MRTFDLAPLYRSTVGFDRLFSMLDQAPASTAAPGYPPYNIERTGENDYRISVAVAGFGESELSIEAKENTLTISGEKQDKPTRRRARCSIRASRPARSSASSSLPTTSRSRARRSRTVSCTSTSCARSPRRRSRARSDRQRQGQPRWSREGCLTQSIGSTIKGSAPVCRGAFILSRDAMATVVRAGSLTSSGATGDHRRSGGCRRSGRGARRAAAG